jgi:chorismate-pyruvate lyase
MQPMKRVVAVFALSSFLALAVAGRGRIEWPDTFGSRVEVLALLQTLNGELLASTSATRTLETWCGEHHMAAPASIVADRVAGATKPPTPEQLQRLGVRDASEVRYRHVELRCGAHVLSEADNWYVPGKLTAAMNALLDTTDTPFGKVVRPLEPYRRTIEATMSWSPLPHGWEQQPHAAFQPKRALAIPKEVFRHRAILYTAQHVPFAEVVETYRGELLAFEHP